MNTPRTDALETELAAKWHHIEEREEAWKILARELDSELSELKAEIAGGAHDSANYPTPRTDALPYEGGEYRDLARQLERELAGAKAVSGTGTDEQKIDGAADDPLAQGYFNMERLLHRLRGWDMLDSCADGPYWKGEIDKALQSPVANRSRAVTCEAGSIDTPPEFQEFCERVWDTDESDPVMALMGKDLKRIFECAKTVLVAGDGKP